MQVLVRDNNIDQALRALKKKLQREGVFREMKRRRFYEKPSERSAQVRRCGERASSLAKRHSARDFFLRLIPLTQVHLYVVGVAHEAGRRFCEDCLA